MFTAILTLFIYYIEMCIYIICVYKCIILQCIYIDPVLIVKQRIRARLSVNSALYKLGINNNNNNNIYVYY